MSLDRLACAVLQGLRQKGAREMKTPVRIRPLPRFASKVEKLAQEIYDLRDACPAPELKAWAKLDRAAGSLTRLAGALARKEKRVAGEHGAKASAAALCDAASLPPQHDLPEGQ